MPATTHHAAGERMRPAAHAAEAAPLRGYRPLARPRPLEAMVARLEAQLRHRERLVTQGDDDQLPHLDHAIAVGAVRIAFREPGSSSERSARARIILLLVWPQANGALQGDVALLLTIAWALDLRRADVTTPARTAGCGSAEGRAGSVGGRPDDAGEERERTACENLGEVLVAIDHARRDARELFARGQALAARSATARVTALGALLCCLPARSRLEAMTKSDALHAIASASRRSSTTLSALVTIAARLEWERWRAR